MNENKALGIGLILAGFLFCMLNGIPLSFPEEQEDSKLLRLVFECEVERLRGCIDAETKLRQRDYDRLLELETRVNTLEIQLEKPK